MFLGECDVLTLVAIDKRFFHDHTPSIDGVILLCLASTVPETSISCLWCRDLEDMAGKEILRCGDICVYGIRLSISTGKEALGRWDEEDVVADGSALARDVALEEGPKERVD